MIGTVLNDSKKQADAIFQLAFRLVINGNVNSVEGLEGGKYIRTSYSEITDENVNLYLE